MMTYAVAAAIALLAIIFVLAPLVRSPRGVTRGRAVEPRISDPIRQAERPSAIDELELDLAMGKLSREDYEQLRARYEAVLPAAVSAHGPALSAQAPARDGAESPTERAESMIRAQRSSGVACSTCGPRPEPDARFCSTCGRTLGACRACGAALEESGGRYCASCGASLAE